MYKFFFNISWRSLTKRGIFPIINIIGLSIGLAVGLLIYLLIYNERSFDKSFRNSKNIYRINSAIFKFMPGETYCTTGSAVGPAMQEAIPEITATVRTFPQSYVVRINDHFLRSDIMWADKDFFHLFDTPFIYGKPEDAMSGPNAIAISEKMAEKLFGKGNPVGETLELGNQHTVEVKAVFKDFPRNSSFSGYQMIGPFNHSYPAWFHEYIQWGNIDFETFCLLSENADTTIVGAQMREIHLKECPESNLFYLPSLQRLDEIHLYSSSFKHSYTSSPSDIGKVKMLSLLAIIILLVACVNYMNLSTARAQKRSKEIGVSKTLGAKRGELIIRLFFETGTLTFISFAIAYLLAFAALPIFNNLLGEQLRFGSAFNPSFLAGALGIWMLTTLIAASYPAIYLSGFPPLLAIRQGSSGKTSHALVRKILTVGQFAAAIVLIAWVMVIQSQIRFINNKDIGYDPHNLIGIRLANEQGANFESLENDYKAQSSVVICSRSNGFPIKVSGSGNIMFKSPDDQQGISIKMTAADGRLADLLKMNFIAGTTLPESVPGDSIPHIILNRKAVEYLEMTPEEVIGKRVQAEIGIDQEQGVIVCGVVENFNFESLHHLVGSYGIHNSLTRFKDFLILRVKEGNLSDQLKTYEQIFKNHFPNSLFEVQFPDLRIEKAYEAEQRTNRVAVCFSILAILVACMGVFGLTAFMAEQRTKEIGIRKVMGASIGNVVSLFTNSYVRLLLISLAIAIPVAWWVSNLYLQDFAYRISPGWWIFVVAAIITASLTLLTVSIQAVKAATANPVKSLKTE